MTEPVLCRSAGAEGAVSATGDTQPPAGAGWRARLETSCDNSDLTEEERQIIDQLPPGYFYDPDKRCIVRNSLDLPECV